MMVPNGDGGCTIPAQTGPSPQQSSAYGHYFTTPAVYNNNNNNNNNNNGLHHQQQYPHHHHPQQQSHHYNHDGRHHRTTTTPSVGTPESSFSESSAASLPATPPDNNNFHHGYYHHQHNSNNTASPSAAIMAYRRQVYSPAYTHDCYGVPAHPSVADFAPPPPTLAPQYHHHHHHYVSQQLVMSSLPPPPPPLPLQQRPYNGDDFLFSSYENQDFQDFGSANGMKSAVYNSSRQMRNLAEKQRRNKLNTCINELSQLVPLISNSSKKIEKTSVLRLSAAYLRLSRLLLGLKEKREQLPVYINEVNLADLMLDDRDIYLMVTSAGKIVFVSHSVENILGHPQIDLMGQSLFNITCLEDHNELKNNLKYQDETSSSSSIITTDDSSLNSNQGDDSSFKMQRRSFYMRLVKKAVSRGEQPEFELVHVVGTLMVQNDGMKSPLLGGNDIVLNAVVRPYNERRVTEVSLLEATREEYITRHQIDGRIIYVDHRISIVSGFMPQEVSGQLAFTYMHKDDVRWVMIALRQMYFKGQSFGSSCYRLLSKNGEFVYMKTHGYLELNPNEDTIESFICVNTLVNAEEGKKEIIKMRERFTPLIRSQSEPGIAAITNNQFMEADSTTSLEDATTEDPKTLDKVVEQMIINIPGPAIDNVKETAQNPGPLPDSQFIKVALLSKSMPPIKKPNGPKFDKRLSLSPQPNIRPITQDRPSVLRVAPPVARQPVAVVVYNQPTNDKTTEKDREYYERRGGILVVPKRQNDVQLPDHSPKKAKFALEARVDSPTCSQYSNQMDDSQSENQLSTDGYGSLDGFPSFQGTPSQFIQNVDENNIDLDPLTVVNIAGLNHYSKTLDYNDSSVDPSFFTPESYSSFDTGVYTEGNPTELIQDNIMHVLQKDGSVESEMLEKQQITLKSKMDQQQGQLKEIQTELNSLSSNADTHFLATNFSNLKAVHEQQQQMLRKLQGVHQNIGV